MTPDPLNELETFYDACREAQAPPLTIPSRFVWKQALPLSFAGMGVGVALAIAMVLMVPKADMQRGREDAESITRMQMVGTEPAPVVAPRAARGGPANA